MVLPARLVLFLGNNKAALCGSLLPGSCGGSRSSQRCGPSRSQGTTVRWPRLLHLFLKSWSVSPVEGRGIGGESGQTACAPESGVGVCNRLDPELSPASNLSQEGNHHVNSRSDLPRSKSNAVKKIILHIYIYNMQRERAVLKSAFSASHFL